MRFELWTRPIARQFRGDLGCRIRRGELHALSPGPFILSYGVLKPDLTIDVAIRWDHRITDAALMARALARLAGAEYRGIG
jgi:hypothetical protein